MEASAAGDGDVVATAAEILLSLRHTPLLHWLEREPPPPPPTEAASPEAEEAGILWPPPAWPKRRRSRHRAMVGKGKGKAADEAMRVLSPATPLEYHAEAGSGASTSGDEGYRSPAAKRQAAPAAASGDGGSGDEGWSSPAKRRWVAVAGGSGRREAVDAVKVAQSKLLDQHCTATSMATEVRPPSERDIGAQLDLNVALDVPWRGHC